MTDDRPGHDRRRFLTRLGATLAAGVGLAATGRFGAGPAAAVNCAIYCQPVACGNCSDGGDTYRCYSQCEGWLPDHCYTGHGCATFCASANAC